VKEEKREAENRDRVGKEEERGEKEFTRKIENSREMRIERSDTRGNRRDGRDKIRRKENRREGKADRR
jgi:hypothetical protein